MVKTVSLKTTVIKITVTEVMAHHIDKVVETGLYGNSRAACAERLISEGLRTLLSEKTLLKLDKPTMI